MGGWIFKCSLTPFQLVLILLYEKPRSLTELKRYAKCLYSGSPQCWSEKSIDRVVEQLRDSDLIVQSNNLLYLNTEKMHPTTKRILLESLKLRGTLHMICRGGVAGG